MTSRFLYPGYNYLGPFNSIDDEYKRRYPPVNELDEAAMYHDMAYAQIMQDAGGAAEAYLRFNEADELFLQQVSVIRVRAFAEGNWRTILAADVAHAVFKEKQRLNRVFAVPIDIVELANIWYDELKKDTSARGENDPENQVMDEQEEKYEHIDKKIKANTPDWSILGPGGVAIDIWKNIWSFLTGSNKAPGVATDNGHHHKLKHPTHWSIVDDKMIVHVDLYPMPADYKL